MRVFAGPNGSGKSTIIKSVRNHTVNGRPIEFGVYINADDILQSLKNGPVHFSNYDIQVSEQDFIRTTGSSGLVNPSFTEKQFKSSFSLKNSKIELIRKSSGERLAQIIADYLRKRLLKERKKFSFETVFSHPSKIDIIKEAAEYGYKVYLYFVSTEDPEINKFRVKEVRVKEGGHDVPEDKIESRYFRSLELMYDAAQHCYQAFFFDNSQNGIPSVQVAHFKMIKGEKQWDELNPDKKLPNWFIKYYLNKVRKS